MSASILPFGRPLPVPRVEITSPGVTKDGERLYFVDIVDHDGSATLWGGADLQESHEAASDCAEDEGKALPILDLTNPTGVLQ